jgi:two-component system, chemotaxis family, CheB/CheR fusion protein
MDNESPLYIIAIGASAGGMEEINIFFDHTALDSVSYVIVQHLSPVFKSRMTELLARHSKLLVKEAEENMEVLRNQVYLIPNDKYMTISNGKLHFTDKENIKGPHLTINTFFTSLAADCGSRAVGIILSGLGSDGTDGAKDIKKAGGMVMARNPLSSDFSSMPSSAIASNVVDLVLEPEAMPDAIEAYVKTGQRLLPENVDEEKNIATILKIINDHLPLDFSDYKRSTIFRRIKRRMGYNNFSLLANYVEFLKETPKEVKELAQDFLISVSGFFRDKEAFDFIESTVIPDLLNKLNAGEELKIWVAGCATGEEAYSLAILIHEQLSGNFKDVVVKIFATDIDSIALAHAGRGLFTATVVKDINPERLKKYFTPEYDQYRIKYEIRKLLIFAPHDLVKNPPYCNMQFISFRNLLIYMMPALQKKIYQMLLFGLRKDGYLFLGSSENPLHILQHLEVVNKKWKIYRNLEPKKTVFFDGFTLPQMVAIKNNRFAAARENIMNNSSASMLAEAITNSLAADMDYLAVCVAENNDVIQTFGDTSKYLLQKNFTLNLATLLPKPLSVAFSTACISARKANKKITIKGIKTYNGLKALVVNLTVSPLNVSHTKRKLLLAIFNEEKVTQATVAGDNIFNEQLYHDKYTMLLEEELKDVKEVLHSTYEQLDASNDNMQSYNEELLSANEEMQSTNEEMQSVNEEMHTINADYQLKNKELLELNDDLNNYFRSNVHGQLFVNNELLLMKFSPGTVNLINLLPSDVGRPLSHISTNIKFETLLEDIKQVMKDDIIITKEIETNDGKWYQVMTMPYLQKAENKKNGAILTFNDVTELKKTQALLNKKNTSLARINEDLDNFVSIATHDLLSPLGNIEMSIKVMNEVKVIDPELNRFLDVINNSVKKFRLLITEIAAIAKIEKDVIAVEMVDVEELVKNIEWSLDDKIKASGAKIVRNLEVKEILFSKKNLRSLLFNLVSNGIKFKGSDAPVINICTVSQEGNVLLSVEDNGIGMNKKDSENIFDMYNRLHPEIEGQGIGLYLVKKIVHAAGSEITLKSQPGRGSKFTINFAAAETI